MTSRPCDVYTDSHGGAGRAAGPTNRRVYSAFHASSPPAFGAGGAFEDAEQLAE